MIVSVERDDAQHTVLEEGVCEPTRGGPPGKWVNVLSYLKAGGQHSVSPVLNDVFSAVTSNTNLIRYTGFVLNQREREHGLSKNSVVIAIPREVK